MRSIELKIPSWILKYEDIKEDRKHVRRYIDRWADLSDFVNSIGRFVSKVTRVFISLVSKVKE